MRQAAGQVARGYGTALQLGFGLCLLLLLAAAALALRLAQGPLELPVLARAIEAQAFDAAGETRLAVGQASIAWQGWRDGQLAPVELRLEAVQLVDRAGAVRAELPDAAVTLSIPWLLRGQAAPRQLVLRAPALRLRRAADGSLALSLDAAPSPGAPAEAPPGPSPLEELLAELMRPPSDATPRGALMALRISGGRVTVEDEALGATWRLEEVQVDLRRQPQGGIAGRGSATAALGAARLPVLVSAEAAGDPLAVAFRVSTPELEPAVIAAAAPFLAPLGQLDAPARIELEGELGADFQPRRLAATLSAGAGRLDLGQGRRIPLAGLEASAEWTPEGLRLPRARLRLAGPGSPVLAATAEARRDGALWKAEARLGLDALPVAELARWWPEGLGGGERAWILANITAGTARDGAWRIAAEAPADLSAVNVTALSGTLEVADATIHWLRPMPPVEAVRGSIAFGLDEVRIRVAGGRQSGGAVQVQGGDIRFAFPPGQVPQAEIGLGLAGPVPDVLAVIRHPRLRLFQRRPLPLTDPQGALEGRLSVGFPLLDALPVEQLRIRAQARLREVRLGDVLLGRPLERGQFDLVVDNDGLRGTGTATLAEIAARIGLEMDFRAGPAGQVVMRETVQARTDGARLAALGLGAEEVLRGPVTLDVRTERRRSGAGRVVVAANLREATLAVDALGWTKPSGQNGGAEAVLRLEGERLQAIEQFRVEAPGLRLRGDVGFGAGTRLERVTIAEGAVEASRFAAEARPPARPGDPWAIRLRGQVLDLRRALDDEASAAPADPPAEPGPAVAVDARFDRVLLGPGRELAAVEAAVQVDGRGVVRAGRLAGRAGERGPFEATIAPDGAGRALRLSAEDAGALLGAFDVLRHLEGGRLSVTARYAHNGAGAPLSGTAEMSDFAVRNAPALGKVLQAMTLYGLLEAMSGPGLGFGQLVAPFRLTPETLTLEDARAFSASLGVTARGTLDRRRRRLAIEGTIVPAYMFNTLLGNIPVLGRLFSPERGGGVFAATFRVQGPADDPQVSVNPLAALTPGFLRGLFGIGQAPAQP